MISQIRGNLLEKHPPKVVVDCNGLGYELDVPMSTFYILPDIGCYVVLKVHFVVRDDAHLLYGFATDQERKIFRLLLKVNGMGARTALSVLSGVSIDLLVQSVVEQNTHHLVKIPGVGQKTASRLILELQGRIEGSSCKAESGVSRDVRDALLALGYSDKEIGLVVNKLPENGQLADNIKTALGLLSG